MVKGTCVVFDPGLTTGVVRVHYSEKGFHIVETDEFPFVGRLRKIDSHVLPLVGQPVRQVIVEEFRLYRSKAQQQINSRFRTVQVIGNIQALCFKHGILQDEILYLPATAKSRQAIPKEFKDVLGTSRHIQDAFKHFRYWWLKEVRK